MAIDLIVGIGLAKNALDIVKGVREALRQKKLTPDEMKDYLDTLQDKLVDVKTALADADDERRTLLRRIEDLTRMADFGSEFKMEHGVYWPENVPYCPICWDREHRPVRLSGPIPALTAPAGQHMWMCFIDKAQFPISRYAGKSE